VAPSGLPAVLDLARASTPKTRATTIDSIRRELLDHVVVLNERHLRRLLTDYVAYYHDDRTHLGLDKATPASRSVDPCPAGDAEVVALPRLGGLHYRYAWRAAA
jgi:hypothetical protein